MARLTDRLEALEEDRRARAAADLRRRLRSVSDEDVARWIHAFRRGAPDEECAPARMLEVEDLIDEALGVRWEDLPDHELERRCALIVDELVEMRRHGIKLKIGQLEKGESE